MGSRYDVDVPITDLDENEEEMINEVLDNSLFDEDFIFADRPAPKFQFISKLKNFLTPNQGGKDKRLYSGESYELQNTRFVDDGSDSFTIYSETEEDTYRPDIELQNTKKTLKKYQFILIIFITLTTLLGVSTLVTKKDTKDDFSQKISSVTPKPILSNTTHDFYPTTLMISIDGLHPHYISANVTPILHNMMVHSYGAPYMVPSFPSSTFPNHWTMVTGLYPSEHGIVGNSFFDPISGQQFINTNPQLSLKEEFWGGEAIWRTAAFQGVSSAIHMWPGSEVPFKTGQPLEVDAYNGSELLSSKVDRIFDWLDKEIDSRPELILTYVPTIDSLGHKYGVSGDVLDEGLTYVDNFIDSILIGLKERNVLDIVNVIVVSDHGMAPTSNDRLIYLDDILDLEKIEHIDGWPLFGLRPYEQYSVQEIYQELSKNHNEDDDPHYQVYLRDEMPEEWNFGGVDTKYQDRIAPVWVVPDVGYSVTTHKDMQNKNGDYSPKGVHGYNNTEVLMRATFLGHGPYFKKHLGDGSIKVEPFYNTEVYNIVCDTLNIVPAPNNGTGDIISKSNVLPQNWQDDLSYPGVEFGADIMRQNATYDMIWRVHEDIPDAEIPTEPSSSLILEESKIGTITPESMPVPSDFSYSSETSFISTDIASLSISSRPDSTLSTSTTGKPKHGFMDLIDEFIDKIGDTYEEIEDAIEDAFDRKNGEEDDED